MKYLLIILFPIVLQACSSTLEKPKPNLLFIWTDEQQYFTMKAYGNEIIQTPNMDRLANESFVFEKAYVAQPVCTPNRAAVMTGLYPHTHGSTSNNIKLRDEIKTLPEIIDDPEYHSGYIGKWHLGDEIFKQRGFETWVSMEDGYSKYYQSHRDQNARSDYYHWLVEKGYTPNDKDNRFSRSFAASLPIEHCKPKFLEEKSIEFLENVGNEPFILYINFLEPHMPFTGPLDSLYASEDIPLPENYYSIPSDDDPSKYRKKHESDKKKWADSEKEFRELTARYWGLVTQVDYSVGAILDKLESLGLSENTIIVYTSDHGDMMGSHQMVAKSVMYEEAVRIPFMLKDPRLKHSHTLVTERVSQIDIVPTLLDLMDQEIPEELQGESLKPFLMGEEFPSKDIFIESNSREDYRTLASGNTILADDDAIESTASTSIRTVISKEGMKLSISNRDKSQLFDLNNDPWEKKNLYYLEEYNSTVKELTAKIQHWQAETNDSISLPMD